MIIRIHYNCFACRNNTLLKGCKNITEEVKKPSIVHKACTVVYTFFMSQKVLTVIPANDTCT